MLPLVAALGMFVLSLALPSGLEWRISLGAAEAQAETELKSPSPSGDETNNQPKPQPSPTEQHTAEKLRGTDDAPFVVKIGPSPDANSESNEQQATRIEKASQDRWTLIFVGITAIFTSFLFFATSGLWVATWRMWRATVKAVADGEKSAKAAGDAAKAAADHVGEAAKAATAMKGAADAAVVQGQAAWRQVELMEAQKEIFRQTFISTHRPKLIVRHMHLRAMNADMPAVIRFTIVNQGQSDALRTEWRAGIVVAARGTHIYGMDGVNHVVRRTLGAPLATGLDHVEDFESPQKISQLEIDEINGGTLCLTFCGVIAYFDGKGDVRRTGFVRIYGANDRRFCVTLIEDNEFQD